MLIGPGKTIGFGPGYGQNRDPTRRVALPEPIRSRTGGPATSRHGSIPGHSDDIDAQRLQGSTQEQTMTFDALAALRAGGNPVDLLTAEQRDVLAQLTAEEVAVLNSVKRRLDAVADAEVEGHGGIKVA